LSATQRIYFAIKPVDTRKEFNDLWAQASGNIRQDRFAGSFSGFTDKDRIRLEILFLVGSGV